MEILKGRSRAEGRASHPPLAAARVPLSKRRASKEPSGCVTTGKELFFQHLLTDLGSAAGPPGALIGCRSSLRCSSSLVHEAGGLSLMDTS
ncbi:hypothetical protein EYF80_060251 [Liparis tanakae]|uniref:Uncharacterized protein n=1 Tax=Liparis tanakae TaxID=230148 RepID=A0A4Z2EM07_9TELE|nr:hypothetical protein EYF80_060251 [Liparis tanakae]